MEGKINSSKMELKQMNLKGKIVVGSNLQPKFLFVLKNYKN